MSDNRVDDALREWRTNHPRKIFWDREYYEEQLTFLDKVKRAFGDTSDAAEQRSLERVDKEAKETIGMLKRDMPQRLAEFLVLWFPIVLERLKDPFLRREPEERIIPSLPPKWMPERLPWPERERMRDAVDRLQLEFERAGLNSVASEHAKTNIYHGRASFVDSDRFHYNGQIGRFDVQIDRAEGSGRYYPRGYDLTLYHGLAPNRELAAGVNVKDLERAMEIVNWNMDFTRGSLPTEKDTRQNDKLLGQVNGIFTDLNRLMASGDPEAKRVHDQLVVRFFKDTPNATLVDKLDELSRQFEHKIHIGLGLTDMKISFEAALQLLNHRSVAVPVPGGTDVRWIAADFSQKKAMGDYMVQPVGTAFNLRSALAAARVIGFPEFARQQDGLDALQRGNSVRVRLNEDGRLVEKYVYADPERNRLATDWMRSEQAKLFQRHEPLASSIEQYVGRQQGTYRETSAPSVVEERKTGSEAVRQPMLWEGEERQKQPVNAANLSSLENQLRVLDFPTDVAKEVLDKMTRKGWDLYYQDVDRQFGEDKVNVAVRFEMNKERDWIDVKRYEVNTTFGDGRPGVFQVYPYNQGNPGYNYTFPEVYRMAAGGKISRTVSYGGEPTEVWRGLALDSEKLPTGEYIVRSVPFDLTKAMNEYPFKEELAKSLAPGYTLDGILSQVRKGEPVQFPVIRKTGTEMVSLDVNPWSGVFKLVRVEEPSNENKNGQAPAKGQGKADTQEKEVESVSFSAGRGHA